MMKSKSTRSILKADFAAKAWSFALVLLVLASSALDADAQNKPDAIAIEKLLAEVGGADLFGASINKATLLDGAQMKTDSDSQMIVVQADQFVAQGRYDLATILWQRVIDQSGDQVFTRDDWTERTLQNEYRKFRSVAGDIEATIAALPPEGLSAYRLKADGEARALMNSADGRGREAVLAEIVRRFFLSKLGDDAAFELACLKLDRGEFLPAGRLLSKILNDYPDPSVKLGEIKLRLAAVSARLGDIESAKEILGELKSQPIPPVPVAVIRYVEEDMADAADRLAVSGKNRGWTLPQGSPARSGLMPEPPVAGTSGLIKVWQQRYQLTLPKGPEWAAIAEAQGEESERPGENADAGEAPERRGIDPFGNPGAKKPVIVKQPSDERIVTKWKLNHWKPVGQVLLRDGKIYFKTHDRIVCCDAATGELSWFGYRNVYPIDAAERSMALLRARYSRGTGDSTTPSGEREVLSFSDMLNQSMALVGDKLLVVQGKAVDFFEDGDPDEAGLEEAEAQNLQNLRIRGRFGVDERASEGRTRENWLFGYHAENGKLQWMLNPKTLLPESKRKKSFAGSPVPYGSIVVIPVHDATSLWLFGLNPDNGEVIWKSFLADEPGGQTNSGSPVRVAIDGGEAYVATGSGVIASVDAISGTLNWALAYPRTSPPLSAPSPRNPYGNPVVKFDGWKNDTIIASGNAIVIAPSDFNFLAAIDRRSGDLLWESARRPIEGEPESDTVLGIADGKVFTAGPWVVRAYKLKGGRLLWEHRLQLPSDARGMVTDAGVFIPVDRSIVQLSLQDGSLLETIKVVGKKDPAPLGNLFTDGEQIYAAGFREITSFRPDKKGKVVPEPAGEPELPAEAGSDAEPYVSLFEEATATLMGVYTEFSEIEDAKGAAAAGQQFDEAGEKLVEIAGRMEELGAPDATVLAGLEERFAVEIAAGREGFNKAFRRIVRINGVFVGLAPKLIALDKKIESLPILKQYGIENSFISTEEE